MFLLCSCSSAEEKLNIPEGILKRIIRTQEQKEKDLEVVMRICDIYDFFAPHINVLTYLLA